MRHKAHSTEHRAGEKAVGSAEARITLSVHRSLQLYSTLLCIWTDSSNSYFYLGFASEQIALYAARSRLSDSCGGSVECAAPAPPATPPTNLSPEAEGYIASFSTTFLPRRRRSPEQPPREHVGLGGRGDTGHGQVILLGILRCRADLRREGRNLPRF